MRLLPKITLLAFLIIGAFSCSDDDDMSSNPPTQDAPNLVEAAQDAGLTTLLDAVGAVDGLDQTLLNAEAITVFAPTNAAFQDALTAFNANNLSELVEAIGGVENLELVLGFHVVPAVAFSDDLAEGDQTFSTLSGQEITVSKNDNAVSVTDANGNVSNVTTADVEIENGVVHVIDAVLLPDLPDTIVDLAMSNDDLSSLVAALEYTGLDETLADRSAEFTVFAPTDDAFSSFLDGAALEDLPVDAVTQILLNHVLVGTNLSVDLETSYTNSLATFSNTDNNLSLYINTNNGVTINGISNVSTADSEASNGVVHIVDQVIELPTVVTFATADPNFGSLVSALTDPGQADEDYVNVLSTSNGNSPAPFTVFAPTDQAFNELLNELNVNSIEEIDSNTLTAALNTHVIAGTNLRSADLSNGTVSTLGADLEVDADNAILTDPNNRQSNIIALDVQAANGVIHAIDTVLLP